ncbi:hypothetical protein [Microbulbifer sp. VAAF005]|uniref:hypothetical protein n=1 Tax=Microbulbifer sp. VAAF005 TaxID=3034230 RepID=UPI0024AD9671|nr:hypothetical protein [Microbulbifer sp. VAAF005]WHI47341.1 hypothetical protein P0078_02875 [Microbulbifer sp. VAAF005]
MILFGDLSDENSLYVDWPKAYERKYEKCEKRLKGNPLGESNALKILPNVEGKQGKWVYIEENVNSSLVKSFAKSDSTYPDTFNTYVSLESLIDYLDQR